MDTDVELETANPPAPINSEFGEAVGDALAQLQQQPDVAVAHFQQMFDDKSLTAGDVGAILDSWKLAIDHPDAFHDYVLAEQPPDDEREGVGDWLNRVRSYVHWPKKASGSQKEKLSKVAQQHGNGAELDGVNPNIRKFETFDPGWATALRGKVGEEWKR